MRYLVFLLLLISPAGLWAQNDSVPYEIIPDSTIPPVEPKHDERYLPKDRSYMQFSFFHADENAQITDGFFRQFNFAMGLIHTFVQRRIWGPQVFIEPLSRFTKFRYKQGATDLSPDTIAHNREWLKIYSFSAGAGNRFIITMPKRYQGFPGLWCELSGGCMVPYYSAFAGINLQEGEGKELKRVWPGLHASPALFGRFRIGYGPLTLLAEYRITRYFKPGSPFANFPAFTFGIALENDTNE